MFTALAPFRLLPNATQAELYKAATARSNPFKQPDKTGEAVLLHRSSVRAAAPLAGPADPSISTRNSPCPGSDSCMLVVRFDDSWRRRAMLPLMFPLHHCSACSSSSAAILKGSCRLRALLLWLLRRVVL